MYRKALPFLCLMLLSFSVSAVTLSIVHQPDSVYVGDYANLLTDEVKNTIITKNQSLYHDTGAQIVIVTVNVLNGYSLEDYAYEVFTQWGIGDSQRNNGLLLLICASERSYYVLQGAGIAEDLSNPYLQNVMLTDLEPGLSIGDYNSGVAQAFDTLLNWFEEYYEGTHYVLAVNSPSDLRGAPRPQGPEQHSIQGSRPRIVLLGALMALLIALPIALDARRYRRWRCSQQHNPDTPYTPFLFGRKKRRKD